MKATVEIPDALFRDAKKYAANMEFHSGRDGRSGVEIHLGARVAAICP